MNAKEILLKLKKELEQSILGTSEVQLEAVEFCNYQHAADLEQQKTGRRLAIALINEELNNLEC